MPSHHGQDGSESGVHATGPRPGPSRAGWGDKLGCAAPLLAAVAARVMVALAAHVQGGLAALAYRWDAEHFLHIASSGYESLEDSAFAPLYPAAVRLLAAAGLPPWAAGLLAANAGGLAFAFLACRLYGPRAAVVVALLPSVALYTSVPYSESLALPLTAAGLLAASRRRWALAGALLGLASLARYQIALPAMVLALAAWRLEGRLRAGLYVAAGPALAGGLVALVYWRIYGDPLVYLHVERAWDAGLTVPLVGQVRWLLDSWFTSQPWGFAGHAIEPWVWAARNLAVYSLYTAGLIALHRSGRRLELLWSASTLLLVASLRGVPAASAPRLAAEAFPAIAALGERLGWTGLLAAAGLEAILIPWVALWHLQAFYA